jgi:hypothetical protein
MRYLLTASILAFALCAPIAGQAQNGAGAALFNKVVESKCNRPDSKLIKPGTADTYNAQARGFNDCLRVYVDNENNKIARITADAREEFGRIAAAANAQIRDIERAINSAIIEVKIVNNEAQPADLPPPGDALAGFPAPACAKPDTALLVPARGKHVPSLASTDRYEAQRLSYQDCVRRYIAQAKGEIVQINANAHVAFKAVADDANPRIVAINDAVSQALADARAAAGERDTAVNAVRSPLRADGLAPGDRAEPLNAVHAPGIPPGTESVTVTGDRLKRSADMPTGEGDPDAISCRAPQQLADSRLMGPEICKYNREWTKLNKDGMNISPDGGRLVRGEKQLTYNPTTCVSRTVYTPQGPQVISYCGTPGGQ